MSPDAATERPILYISGPYSPGYGRTVEDNIRIAREYATRAWNRGWAAITPHLNTAGFELDCTDLRHEDWLAGDLSILSHLDPARGADAAPVETEQRRPARVQGGLQARVPGVFFHRHPRRRPPHPGPGHPMP